MLSPISNAITILFFYTKNKIGVAPSSAPTVNVGRLGSGSLIVTNGTLNTTLITGLYSYTLAAGSTATADVYYAVSSTSDTTVDAQNIPVMWVVGLNNSAGLDSTGGRKLQSGTGAGQLSLTAGTVSPSDGSIKAATFAANAIDANAFNQTAADKIWASVSRSLTDKANFSLVAAYDPAKTAAQAGNAMTLTTLERAAIATQVELQIMDDTDSNAVLQAIVNKINSVDTNLAGLSIAAIASAVWDQARATHTAAGSFGEGVIIADKTNFSLTAAYDAAKTPSFSGADRTILTNISTDYMRRTDSVTLALLQPNYAPAKVEPDNTTIQALRTDYTTARAVKLDNLDVTVGSRLAAITYTAPANASIASILTNTIALLARTDPSAAVTAIKTVTDVLGGMIVGGKFTSFALSSAPTGGGGGSGLSGPSSVTIHFEDQDHNALPDPVDFTILGVGAGRSDTNGLAEFGLVDGDYIVVTRNQNNILFTNTMLTVLGTTEITITGNASTLPISDDPGQTLAIGVSHDGQGVPQPNVSIDFEMLDPYSPTDAWNQKKFTFPSDGSGIIQVPIRKGTLYRVRREGGEWKQLFSGTGATVAIPKLFN
jgi:hypothetical protein